MSAVRRLPENGIDDAGKTADHDKVAQSKSKEDVVKDCVKGHCQKQGAVQFHSGDIFPVGNKDRFVPPHFHSVHIQFRTVIVDHLWRFEKVHIGEKQNLRGSEQQKEQFVIFFGMICHLMYLFCIGIH